jgi:hypothetical protein
MDMAKAKTKAPPKTKPADADVAPRAARKAALAAHQADNAAKPKEEPQLAAPDVPEARQAEVEAMFAKADQKGDPRFDEVTAGLHVRGY